MATHLEKKFSIDAPLERVMSAMRDPEQIKEADLSRGALSVTIADIAKDDTRHEYEVNEVIHARTVSGIDKSKTETNRTRVKWELAKKSGAWTWSGEHKSVKINGTYTLREQGAGTSVTLTADIDVGIPIAGRVLEKKIASGFEDEWPTYIARVGRYAKK